MNPTWADLTGRKALVSGGASGIGAACIRRLTYAGAHVTVLDVNADRAEQVAAEVGGARSRTSPMRARSQHSGSTSTS